MPQLIQRAPLGLLSLLDSKAGGIAPNALSDLVQPTVELLPLYGLSVRRKVNLSIAAAGVVVGFNLVGSGLGIVPSGETWRLLNLTGVSNNVVAGGMNWSVGYANPSSQFSMIGQQIANPTGIRSAAGGECDRWLEPGSYLGIWVASPAAGGDVVLFAHYERYTL